MDHQTNLIRRVGATAVGTAVLLTSVLAVDSAASASAASDGEHVDLTACSTGVACSFSLGGIPVHTDDRVEVERGSDGDVVIRGSLTTGEGTASWNIAESELAFEPTEHGHRYLAGSVRFADVETPVVDLVGLPFATLGIASGHDLAALGAHTNQDRTYWYFHAAAGVTIAPGDLLAGTPADFRPWPVPVEASVVFVLDPSDPFAYLGGSCDVVSALGSKLTSGDGEQASAGSPDGGDGEQASGGSTDRHDEERGESTRPPRSFATIAADAVTTFMAGDCGIGFSAGALIPVHGVAGTTGYGAHVVIDAPVPAPLGLSVDGTTTMRIDRGVRLTGTGDISVGVGPIGDVLGVSLPLGDAAVDVELSDERFGVAIEGALATEEAYELPLLREPITFPADAHVAVDGRFGGDAVGLDPDSFFEFGGALSILDTPLADANVRLDRAGATVAGMMSNGITTTAVEGRIDGAGAQLTGRYRVDVPLNLIGEAADATIEAADAAQADVDRLDHEMDRTRQTIRAERAAANAELRSARADVVAARASLATFDRNIGINNSKISYLKRRISNEKRWYRRLPWYRKPRYAARHVGRVMSWSAAIAGLHTANASNVAARRTTEIALTTAEDVVRGVEVGIDALPTDGDPRMIALITAHASATAVLDATRLAAEQFRLSTSYHGAVELTIGPDGTGGSFELLACDDGCATIAAGSMRTDGGVTIGCAIPAPGHPEICVRL